MDLCGPVKIQSRGGKKYIMVVVDDYSRFTWTMFLKSKDETYDVLMIFVKMIQTNCKIAGIMSDHGTEFENAKEVHSFKNYTKLENEDYLPPSDTRAVKNPVTSEGFRSLFDGDTVEFKVESSSDGRTKVVHVTSSDGASFSGVATT
ncbi:hypothetical protein MTR67_022150 [Solanum verrucosum]|uniref:Integrase catalytic domain-containing protein n=1 Tax=Solanum verrucosum TaxID=315347 RepID=A0AAF0TWG0_SOLVR|nr:hypothetical protein MTR67_022150 [Solanum verrucosum]